MVRSTFGLHTLMIPAMFLNKPLNEHEYSWRIRLPGLADVL